MLISNCRKFPLCSAKRESAARGSPFAKSRAIAELEAVIAKALKLARRAKKLQYTVCNNCRVSSCALLCYLSRRRTRARN